MNPQVDLLQESLAGCLYVLVHMFYGNVLKNTVLHWHSPAKINCVEKLKHWSNSHDTTCLLCKYLLNHLIFNSKSTGPGFTKILK